MSRAAAGALCAHTRSHVKLTSTGQTRDVWTRVHIVSGGCLAARLKFCRPQTLAKRMNQQVLFHTGGDVAAYPPLAEA